MYEVFFEEFRVPRGGPDQLKRCKEAAAGSLLTCRSSFSFISQTMGRADKKLRGHSGENFDGNREMVVY